MTTIPSSADHPDSDLPPAPPCEALGPDRLLCQRPTGHPAADNHAAYAGGELWQW